ncbi:MAG: NapC/NirT family cytochrome c [Candidatus Methylomirabilales bacterium]
MGKRAVLIAIGMVLIFVLLGGAIVGGRVLERQPTFCASCHEERENYERWLSSGAAKEHKTCIECHTGPRIQGVIDGQLRGLRHVVTHFRGTFETPLKAFVPNTYCIPCHSLQEMAREHHEVPAFIRKRCAECHNHKPGVRFSGEAEGEDEEQASLHHGRLLRPDDLGSSSDPSSGKGA